MIRKFNYTGRKKLKRQRISISVENDKPIKTFNAVLNLKGLRLPDDAKVYIEPYHKSSFMRFYFGTVSNPTVPENTILSDIPPTSVLRFRVKVVDETKKLGRIIRLADKIKPSNADDSGNRKSILHIDWDQDLDQQIFRLSFPENDYPRLEINKRIENAKELIKSDQIFRSLVFPVAVREVSRRIANTWEDFEEEDDSWQNIWLKFFNDVLRVNVEVDLKNKDEDEINYWVEEVVAAFCRQNKFRTKFEQALNKAK